MSKELTKKELIEEIFMPGILPAENWSKQTYDAVMEAHKWEVDRFFKLAKQLSDKPQISEEDFDKLKDELISYCIMNFSQGASANKRGETFFNNGLEYNINLYLKEVLEKYLKQQPPLTQGDKIRAMSNEELAEWRIIGNMCKYCNYGADKCMFGDFEVCKQGILEFLNSKIETDKKGE